MDTPLLILYGAVALVVLGAAVAALRKVWFPGRLPYRRRTSLLTPAEIRFYRALVRAVPVGEAVFVKVRLLDVVAVPDAAWATHGARASGMHLDFVVADAGTLLPLLVLELDDKTHQLPQAKERDEFKNRALAAAGVPLLRVRAAAKYDLEDLAAKIRAAMS